MGKGARIGYWRGSIAGLIDDIQACQPFSACCCAVRSMADARGPSKSPCRANSDPHKRRKKNDRYIHIVAQIGYHAPFSRVLKRNFGRRF